MEVVDYIGPSVVAALLVIIGVNIIRLKEKPGDESTYLLNDKKNRFRVSRKFFRIGGYWMVIIGIIIIIALISTSMGFLEPM